MTKHNVTIYTDGACRGNPGVGGWGAYLIFSDKNKKINGFASDTTNNQMELSAAIYALKELQTPSTVNLYTDSQYVLKGITEWIQNWKCKNWLGANRKPIKNKSLWQELDSVRELHDIQWHWVKGHSGNPGNELADQLANDAIDQQG